MAEPIRQRSAISFWNQFLIAALLVLSTGVSSFQLTSTCCGCYQRALCNLDATARQSDEDFYNGSGVSSSSRPPSTSSSSSFAMDPTSETAREILRDGLHLSAEQHQQLAKLAVLINDWNGRVNLISRRDCSRDVVFGRHILPSLAPLAVLSNGAPRDGAAGGDDDDAPPLQFAPGQLVCDVGTGGGLPGLPLAIARPDLQFTLVDSVGKKIVAVRDMADRLGLTNVRTVHGRAEDLADGRHGFDWVVGRSVAAIPTYALWIQHLLKTGTDGGGGGGGHLVYLVGGEIEEEILDRAVVDEGIGNLLGRPDVSDKRVIIFPEPAVRGLALESRETLRVPRRGGGAGPARSAASDASRPPRQKANTPRGQWTKRESATPKRRGYENFQRFDSLSKRPTD